MGYSRKCAIQLRQDILSAVRFNIFYFSFLIGPAGSAIQFQNGQSYFKVEYTTVGHKKLTFNSATVTSV